MAFIKHPVCRVVIRSCTMTIKHKKKADVEVEIAEFLKHAPNKPGGSRYKDQRCNTTDNMDEENMEDV
ncbi:hypothetical protein EOD39_11871 [Acipenser ruthenus]|uniref:Uncharacterized protein n=1 Tax=Acipenser ruthenus TaxID=7906 RepID=A0A662YUQ6_ACIRT|nr:hypothetical protein EOD39_11871 [Acipenser ruthenus]